MTIYADYKYYAGEYGGSEIPETEFLSCARKASLYIDEITHGGISADNTSEAVKCAVCAVSEVVYKDDQQLKKTGGQDVKSENTDGYSVSYVVDRLDGETHEDTLRRKMYQAARGYLLVTGLLYLGVGGW